MAIELASVSRIFTDATTGVETAALSDVDLLIADNEFCALLGPPAAARRRS